MASMVSRLSDGAFIGVMLCISLPEGILGNKAPGGGMARVFI